MNDFVERLVALLNDEQRPLSRNRHFHTFDNPDGRKAMRISRLLRAMSHDILQQARRGEPMKVAFVKEKGQVRVQLQFVRLKAQRTAYLSPREFELLLQNEDVRKALDLARKAA